MNQSQMHSFRVIHYLHYSMVFIGRHLSCTVFLTKLIHSTLHCNIKSSLKAIYYVCNIGKNKEWQQNKKEQQRAVQKTKQAQDLFPLILHVSPLHPHKLNLVQMFLQNLICNFHSCYQFMYQKIATSFLLFSFIKQNNYQLHHFTINFLMK